MYDNFYSDHRVRAANKHKYIKSWDEKSMMATVLIYDDEGEEIETEASFEFAVCPTCQGKGSHVNPSIDCNGISADDFADDPEFLEEYFSGVYDVPCYECGGLRVVPEITDISVKNMILDQEEEDEAFRRECEAERRMGA